MLSYRTIPVMLAMACSIGASPVMAQRAPSGIGFAPSALVPHHRLGPGTIAGLGAELTIGISPRVALVGSTQFYREIEADGRTYNLRTPTVEMRASLLGSGSDLALLLGASALDFQYTDNSSVLIPAVGAGLAIRMPVVGPIHAQFSARNWFSYVREGETGTMVRDAGIAYSPDFRVGLSVLLRARQKTLGGTDVPLAHAQDFRPIEASSVAREPERSTGGRDHVHSSSGAALDPVTGLPLGESPAMNSRQYGTLYFALGSFEINPTYRDMIEGLAAYLLANPESRIELLGYADPSGSPAFNLGLAESRANMLRERLVRLYRIPAERIVVISMGIDQTARTAAAARRVDIVAKEPGR
jgi:outer membrane protein OmpA-like peptidoglycan-associated protein